MTTASPSSVKVHALRLLPGDDLRLGVENFATTHEITAGFIVTAVGSLRRAALRLANEDGASLFAEKFEIVSLVGTLSPDGAHLHIALADNTGKTLGGHLLPGCEIYTTAEIVVATAEGLQFSRERDGQTGFRELVIRAKP